MACPFAGLISLAKACQCYYVEHGTNLLCRLNRVTSALVPLKCLKLSHSGKNSVLNVWGGGGRGPRRGRLGREWTVIEKYQSKTRQRPGRGSYYVNPVRWSTGRAQMHFFCIGNAPLLSKLLSPVTGGLVSPDGQQQGGEGGDYQVEHVAITALFRDAICPLR